jgi:hypothetical protein
MGARNRMVRTLDRLEQQARDQQQSRRQDMDRKAAEQRRWEETLDAFGAVLPEDLVGPVATALQTRRGPLWRWLDNLVRGRCRLPECLTGEVMRRLVQVRLEAARDDLLDGVCLRCGLQYPLPQFPGSAQCGCNDCQDRQRQRAQSLAVYERLFDGRGCPACGASTKVGEMAWAHLVEDGYWFAPGRASTSGDP